MGFLSSLIGIQCRIAPFFFMQTTLLMPQVCGHSFSFGAIVASRFVIALIPSSHPAAVVSFRR